MCLVQHMEIALGAVISVLAVAPALASNVGGPTSASSIDGADLMHSVWITPGWARYGIFATGTGWWQCVNWFPC
jgi:hypothetical protein